MGLATLDAVGLGARPVIPILKLGTTMENVGVAHSLWYTPGVPGASTATAVGVNGEAVTPALGSTGGRIRRTNPVSGNSYLARLSMQATQAGSLWLIDRLWQNSGLSVTSTTAQAITPAALPARDNDGGTNGVDVMAGIEWSAAGGAGIPTVTLTYTDQDGNAGATGSFVGQTTPQAGTFEIFPLAAGDTGVRAPTSFIQSATRTSGTMHLVLFRLLAHMEFSAANVGAAIDYITSAAPRIYDDSVLQLLWFPSSTTAANFAGSYVETQG